MGVAHAQTANLITVEGNRRVEATTIRSYSSPGASGRLDETAIDAGYKALIATGLFQDVRISQPSNRLVVTVIENPVINRIAFEGNSKVKEEQLKAEIQSKERGTLSRPLVQSDVQRIVEIYRRSGRFDVSIEPKIIELPNSRVDLVFEINEGDKTDIRTIEFIGNKVYSAYRLSEVIKTSKTTFLSFLQNTNIYDPDRLEADRDLLRRFYLKHGYIDVRIVAATAISFCTIRQRRDSSSVHDRGRRAIPRRRRGRGLDHPQARSRAGAIPAAVVRRRCLNAAALGRAASSS